MKTILLYKEIFWSNFIKNIQIQLGCEVRAMLAAEAVERKRMFSF